METSRDDFVIAVRSAFLNKGNKQRFSLVALIFFSIIFLFLGKFNFKAIDYLKISIKEIVYRSSFIVSIPENYIKKSYLKIEDHFNFYNNYQNIKSELEILKSQKKIDNFVISENKRIKKIIDDYIIEDDDLIAKVLIDKKSPFLRSIVVNKGSKDNIKLGMAVFDNNYLVGKVVEVNYISSRVLLLSDLNSKIPVIIEPGSIESIISGTGKEYGIIQYLRENHNIQEGSIVYTSGYGGLFKAGLPIGKIQNSTIEVKNGKILKNKEVFFFSDFSQLRFVKIVSYKKDDN